VIHKVPNNPEIYICKKNRLKDYKYKKVLELDDLFMTNIEVYTKELFFLPIHFHPKLCSNKIEESTRVVRKNTKDIGVLFIGNANKNYNKNNKLFHDKYKISSRYELLDYARKNLSDLVCEPKNETEFLNMLNDGKLIDKIVLIDKFSISGHNSVTGIPEYLEILGRSRYFLHTSGVVIPYCHNHMESLACGCIPISEFTHYYPNLSNLKLSVTFDTLDDFAQKIRHILSAQNDILDNSGVVGQFYEEYFSFNAFNKKLEQFLNSNNKKEIYFKVPI
jgi:hypothetical protein